MVVQQHEKNLYHVMESEGQNWFYTKCVCVCVFMGFKFRFHGRWCCTWKICIIIGYAFCLCNKDTVGLFLSFKFYLYTLLCFSFEIFTFCMYSTTIKSPINMRFQSHLLWHMIICGYKFQKRFTQASTIPFISSSLS